MVQRLGRLVSLLNLREAEAASSQQAGGAPQAQQAQAQAAAFSPAMAIGTDPFLQEVPSSVVAQAGRTHGCPEAPS
jgi:hypothetical protein